MKKWSVLLVLILLFSFCLPVYAQTGDVELFLRYQEQKKNPWVGVLASWLFPSLGHAYAENWERGAKFLAAEIVEIGIMLWAFSDNETVYTYYGYEERGTEKDAIGGLASLAFVVTRVWEYVDAYQEVERYNQRLLEKISVDPGFKIGKEEATIYFTYNF